MITLRGYQNDCIEGNRKSCGKGHHKILNVAPTASGKTTIFGAIVDSYLRSNPHKRAVVISHLGLLTEQTGDRFQSEWGINADVFQADRFPRADARAIISTMQSFRDEDKLLQWGRRLGHMKPTVERLNVGLIIIDEAHFVGSDSYETIMDMFPNAYVLGFTATPFRQNKLMSNMFDDVAFTISMQELIDQGFLVPPEINLTPFDPKDPVSMYSMIANIYKEKHAGQKAVVYLKSIIECNDFRNIMVEQGITCSAVTSKLTGKARDQLLKDYRNGDGPDMLVTVDVLTAGFDSPNLMALFMPYKVGSVTTYLQRVGRGLRPDPKNPSKKHCDIYAGSDSPGIEDGFWERITQQVLNAGKANYDNMLDELEFNKEAMSKEHYTWTKEVVAMANKVKERGMHGLFDMIVKKELPHDMLNLMVKCPPMTVRKGLKTPPTAAQMRAVQNIGMWKDGLTKQECSALIDSYKKSKGWTPPADEVVPSGRHKGKHFSQVPPLYWKSLARYGQGNPIMRAYNMYKKKVKGDT